MLEMEAMSDMPANSELWLGGQLPNLEFREQRHSRSRLHPQQSYFVYHGDCSTWSTLFEIHLVYIL